MFVCLFVCLFVCFLFVCLFGCVFVCFIVCLFVCLLLICLFAFARMVICRFVAGALHALRSQRAAGHSSFCACILGIGTGIDTAAAEACSATLCLSAVAVQVLRPRASVYFSWFQLRLVWLSEVGSTFQTR